MGWWSRRQFRGKVCFLTTVDIQTTLPRGIEQRSAKRLRSLVEHWSVPAGGLIVFNYGQRRVAGRPARMTHVMFDEFVKRMEPLASVGWDE